MSNIVSQLRHWSRRKPDKIAIEQDDVRITYADLFRLVLATRSYLEGVLTGDRKGIVVISMGSPADAFISILAARWLGYTTVFISRADLASAIKFPMAGHLRAIVVSEAEEQAGRLLLTHETEQAKVQIPAQIYSSQKLSRLHLEQGSGPLTLGNHIVYTSGSSGRPKFLSYSQSFEESFAIGRNKRLRILAGSRVNNLRYSLSAIIGWLNHLSCVYAGSTLINNTGDWIRDVFFQTGSTHVVIYPTRIDALLEAIPRYGIKKNNKLCCLIGGGFVALERIKRIRDEITEDVRCQMGTTEGGTSLSSKFKDDEDAIWLEIAEGAHLEIVDSNEHPTPPGEEGEIRVKILPGAPDQYLFNEQLTAERFRNGWFYTGDLAVQRADGRVRLLGRINESIAYPGGKLPVEPVEAEISAYLRRSNVFVFSHQNDRFEDEVVVCLEGPAEATEDDVRWLREKFGSLSSLVVRSIARFPTLPSGKIDRMQLRKSVLADKNADA